MNIEDVLAQLQNNKNFHFKKLITICKAFLGEPRIGQGSHSYLFKTGRRGDPMLSLQPDEKNKKMAKPYQVDDVRKVLERKKEEGEI